MPPYATSTATSDLCVGRRDLFDLHNLTKICTLFVLIVFLPSFEQHMRSPASFLACLSYSRFSKHTIYQNTLEGLSKSAFYGKMYPSVPHIVIVCDIALISYHHYDILKTF